MAEQGVNVKELAQLFLEKYPIILLAAALSTAVAYHKSQDIEPNYRAMATIQVDYQQSSVLDDIEQVNSQDFSEYDVLNTIVATISNTKLMRQVINDNDLINRPEIAGKYEGSGSIDELARSLVGRTRAELREDTRLIDLTITDRNRKLAQDLINLIAAGYIKQHANRRIASNQLANTVLTNEAERLKLKLRNAEEALIEFRKTSKLVVSLDDRTALLAETISKRSDALDALQGEISLLRADLNRIEEFGEDATQDELRSISSISSNQLIQDSYAKVQSHEGLVNSLLTRYKEKHPKVVAAKRDLQDVTSAFNQALRDSPFLLEAQLSQLENQASSLQEQLKSAENESLQLSTHAVEYNVLQREVEATKALYNSVMNRIKEIDLTSGLQDEVISIVEEAETASNISPSGDSAVMMGLLFGIAIGMGIIYLLHMLDTTLKSVDQAEQTLELPALGAIPGSEPKNRLAKSRLIMLSDPSSSCAEAFRSLRANIESLGSHNNKVTLFTSSMPAEGKTFTCINYALTLAQRGLKTIVIDLDLRHPSVGGEFTFTDESLSVADILQDPRAFSQFSEDNLENPTENLFVMPVGGQLPNPAEQLASESVINLVRRATEQFDRVIIDSAPLNPVGDTLSIVQMVDVICMVIRCKKTPSRIIQRSLETLRRFNSPASGVILNFVPAKKSMGNYYYYGGGKSPYEGVNHYPTQTTPTPGSRASRANVDASQDEGSGAPTRHRRRRVRRPDINAESERVAEPSVGNELTPQRRRIRRPEMEPVTEPVSEASTSREPVPRRRRIRRPSMESELGPEDEVSASTRPF